MNITAKLVPYSEVPHQTMLPLNNWLGGFEIKGLCPRVAVASNDKGPLVYVCYIRIDDSFLITAMVPDSKATAEDVKQAAGIAESLIEEQAQLMGVTNLYMVAPDCNTCTLVNTYPPRFVNKSQLPALSHVAYQN